MCFCAVKRPWWRKNRKRPRVFKSPTVTAHVYLQPKWGPLFWMEFGPSFGGFQPKNRGQTGSRSYVKRSFIPMAKLQTFCNCKPLILMDRDGSVKPWGCHGCIPSLIVQDMIFFPGKKWLVVTWIARTCFFGRMNPWVGSGRSWWHRYNGGWWNRTLILLPVKMVRLLDMVVFLVPVTVMRSPKVTLPFSRGKWTWLNLQIWSNMYWPPWLEKTIYIQ